MIPLIIFIYLFTNILLILQSVCKLITTTVEQLQIQWFAWKLSLWDDSNSFQTSMPEQVTFRPYFPTVFLIILTYEYFMHISGGRDTDSALWKQKSA